MSENRLAGVWTALISPIDAFPHTDGQVNESLWSRLIERQIEAKVDGVIVAGSTGEGQTMTDQEWAQLVQKAATYTDRIQVMASVGASATWRVIELAKKAKELGATSLLVSSPPYNKPTPSGLIAHFSQISKATNGMPMMVYNIPGRTAVNISAETMRKIWKIPGVESLKESAGDWNQYLQMQEDCPPGKFILSGDDPSSLAFWSHGAQGTVSVLGNLAPKHLVKMWRSFQSEEWRQTRELFFASQELTRNLFCESNPIPIKWAVSHLLETPLPVRLPLEELSALHQKKLTKLISELRKDLELD